MTRPLRIEFPGVDYHVAVHGDWRSAWRDSIWVDLTDIPTAILRKDSRCGYPIPVTAEL